jgi:uncharacterized heparinase superfamily protein
MAGLHDMAPTVEKRCVTRAVVAPIRAAAAAASQPAWPPPITMTSKKSIQNLEYQRLLADAAVWVKMHVSRETRAVISRETKK